MRIYDITPPITPKLGVWPGDTSPTREVLLDINRGATVTLSTLRATVHLGAHADAPSHYSADAPAIEERSLDYYLGRCQVVRVAAARGSRVSSNHISTPITAPRVLIDTTSFPDPYNWNKDFAALDPALVDDLHRRGVRLIGLDSPSVDPMESKDLPAHKRFLANDMAILEGLMLRNVPVGEYELIALPLPLVGFDASPVRAILRATGG
jgi:arylformamidase